MSLFERLTEETLTEGIARGGIVNAKDTPPHVQQLAKLIGKATIWTYHQAVPGAGPTAGAPVSSYLLTFRDEELISVATVKKALRLKVTFMGTWSGMLAFRVDA